MSDLSWYDNLPLHLKNCITKISQEFSSSEEIKQEISRLSKTFGSCSNILQVAVFNSFSSRELFSQEETFLCCYHFLKNKTLPLGKILSIGKNVILRYTINERLIIKWFRKNSLTTSYEIDIYNKLKSLGCSLPYFSSKYRFWNDPVLILERMEELTEKDDYVKLGVHVLEQLEYLHTFGVHNDIKPNNILRLNNRYYLIDYGGVACRPFKNGYLRWNWSSRWTSQKIHGRKQVTTPRNDFFELGYTMNALEHSLRRDFEVRNDFSPKLQKYMDYVRSLRVITRKTYRDLKTILQK